MALLLLLLPHGCSLAARLASECWSRERIALAAAATDALAGIRVGDWIGEEREHDPSNWWTKARFTGRSCRSRIYRNADGRFLASVNFLPAPVALTASLSTQDFYLGLVDADSVLIVQQFPGGLAATHTNFSASGVLNYGQCGADGYFIRECIADSSR